MRICLWSVLSGISAREHEDHPARVIFQLLTSETAKVFHQLPLRPLLLLPHIHTGNFDFFWQQTSFFAHRAKLILSTEAKIELRVNTVKFNGLLHLHRRQPPWRLDSLRSSFIIKSQVQAPKKKSTAITPSKRLHFCKFLHYRSLDLSLHLPCRLPALRGS